MNIIELHNDNASTLTQEMKNAMVEYEAGDRQVDTRFKLEKMAALMLGKEEALFVKSGPLGNELAILTHTVYGDTIISQKSAHILGTISKIKGLHAISMEGNRGIINMDELEKVILERKSYNNIRLISIENTHSRSGGAIIPIDHMIHICKVAHENGISSHLDGARLFNAAVALNVPVIELTKSFDTVLISLNKGLCAPAGCLLAGKSDFISKARAKISVLEEGTYNNIAAAGLVALSTMINRLNEDHIKAKKLAELLSEINGIFVNAKNVQTNIVNIDIIHSHFDAQKLAESLNNVGVRVSVIGQYQIRFVTHKDVGINDIYEVLKRIKKLLN